MKFSGNEHLVPFLQGLVHLGRPSDVDFPKELMGQGAALVLSGLNNTMAFQSNPDWIWPCWHERQCDPTQQSFVPTGMNLVTANLTYRNWTSLGLPGSDVEVMVDPVGMVTMGELGWSFFPYMRAKGQVWAPPRMKGNQVRQRLQAGPWPVVETHYGVENSLHWWSECEVVLCEDEELVLFTQEVENRSQVPVSAILGVSLRPYNPMSLFHIHRIKYEDQLWRINRKAALWLMDTPDRVYCGDRNQSDPVMLCSQGEKRVRQSSRSGVAAGAAEWDVRLEPWERKRFVAVGTLRKRTPSPMQLFSRPTWNGLTLARDQNRDMGRLQAETGMQINIPEDRWMTAWNAMRQRLFVFDDGDHFSPGTMMYHHFWIRDNAFLAMTHTQLGLHAQVGTKMNKLMNAQNSSGYFCSQEGEWDANGQALHTMVEHVIATGDMALLTRLWPCIRRGAEWILNQCQRTQDQETPHRGLLPAGFSAEHFGPHDHYFWDAWWSLQGLADAIWAADVLGEYDIRNRFAEGECQLRRALESAVRQAFVRMGSSGLPSSPYRKVDSSAIGNLVALAPLGLVTPDVYWLRPTLNRLWNENLFDGMFFQKIIHTGLNAYLSIQLARAFLACGDERWQNLLQAVLDHASPTWTWPEAIHPLTGGGCMGDGDHGWAIAEVLSFLGSLLVRVQDGCILLGHELPSSWYTANMNVEAREVVTRHGVVSWQMRGRGELAEFSWSVKRNQFQKKAPLILTLPVPLGLEHPQLTGTRKDRKRLALTEDSGSILIPLNKT